MARDARNAAAQQVFKIENLLRPSLSWKTIEDNVFHDFCPGSSFPDLPRPSKYIYTQRESDEEYRLHRRRICISCDAAIHGLVLRDTDAGQGCWLSLLWILYVQQSLALDTNIFSRQTLSLKCLRLKNESLGGDLREFQNNVSGLRIRVGGE